MKNIKFVEYLSIFYQNIKKIILIYNKFKIKYVVLSKLLTKSNKYLTSLLTLYFFHFHPLLYSRVIKLKRPLKVYFYIDSLCIKVSEKIYAKKLQNLFLGMTKIISTKKSSAQISSTNNFFP